MTSHLVLTALRSLRRRKGYAALNVAGLGVGMACCLLIALFVRDELRYDAHHERADRIYRVAVGADEDGQPTNANGAFSLGPALQQDLAEVERAVRFRRMGWGEKRVVARDDQRFAEDRFFFADSSVFDVFTHPFLRGDPATALAEPYRVVLTASTAERYFGEADPLGQTIAVDTYNDGRFEDYTVTGVVEDLPAASHFRFDFLASWESQRGRTEGWGFDEVWTYALLAPGADPAAVEAGFPAFTARRVGPDREYALHLQPLLDIRLHSDLRGEIEPNGSMAFVRLFSAIALFVVLLACVNYMNLATAQATQRAKEVGVRKVLGAGRGRLARQFLAEAVLLSSVAGVLALVLAQALLPVFNAVAGKEMTLGLGGEALLLLALPLVAAGVGVLAGTYPAFVLTRFAPAAVLRGAGSVRGPGGARLRQGLVVFQFAVSIALLACTAAVHRQMDHLRSIDLGFAREQLVVLPLNDELRQQYEAARSAFLRNPSVLGLAASEQVPGRAGNGAGFLVEGQDEPSGETRLFVTPEFHRTYGIPMAAGRDFDPDRPADADDAFIINEAYAEMLGWTAPEEAVGRAMTMYHMDSTYTGTIVGVAQDFQLYGLRDGVYPVAMKVMPLDRLNFLSVRIRPERASETLAQLESTWARLAPSYPFDYYFLDRDFERLHAADRRLGQVVGLFAILAVLVAALGLFGLAAFSVERRTKEIGIRKVLGASAADVVRLLTTEYAVLVGLAFVVGTAVAVVILQEWLASFAYRMDLGADVFILAGALALATALLAVGGRALHAALVNPVDALRSE